MRDDANRRGRRLSERAPANLRAQAVAARPFICLDTYIRREASAMLSLLLASEQSVGEIERQLQMPQPAVSKHLRVAARGRVRGGDGRRTAPPLPAEAGTAAGDRRLAGALPPVLVCSRRRARASSRPRASIHSNQQEGEET